MITVFLSAAILLTMGVTVADDTHALCVNGVQSVGKGYLGNGFPRAERFGRLVGCCPLSCGESCGGVGCDTMPGGAEDCCVASFVTRMCDYGHDTHCLIPPRGDQVRRDALGEVPAAKSIKRESSACKALSTSNDRFLIPVYSIDCESPPSGGNNLLVWFHALALAHAQRRTLLAPPWCSVPANETWDLDRLAVGGPGLVRVEPSFCRTNILRDSPAACTDKATGLLTAATHSQHNGNGHEHSSERAEASKARTAADGRRINATQHDSSGAKRHSTSKHRKRNEMASNNNIKSTGENRAKIDGTNSKSSGEHSIVESNGPPSALTNNDDERPEWLRVATQNQQQRRLFAHRSKVDRKSPGGPLDGHLKRGQRHDHSETVVDSVGSAVVGRSQSSDSSTSGSGPGSTSTQVGNRFNAALPRCHSSRKYTLESLGESSRRVVAIGEPEPSMDVYVHQDASKPRPYLHYPPVLPLSFVVDSASPGGLKRSSSARNRGDQSIGGIGDAISSDFNFHPLGESLHSKARQNVHAAIPIRTEAGVAWAETKWGDSSINHGEWAHRSNYRGRSSRSNRVSSSDSGNHYDLTWRQGEDSEIHWRRLLVSSDHNTNATVVPTVLQNLRFAAPVRQRAAAALDALGVATTRDRAAGHATFGLLVAFVDVLEPTGSNSLRVDDDTFNANRENRGAERRHLNARALRAAGTISSGSTSKGSMANEFAPPSAMTKCDRKSAHRSSTLNCQPTSLLKIADQLADAALSTKRQNNKELATWRSNSGGSGAEDEPAIAYVCTDAAPDEVHQLGHTLAARGVQLATKNYLHPLHSYHQHQRSQALQHALSGLSPAEVVLVEAHLAYSAAAFLGSRHSAMSAAVALLRLSRRGRPVLDAIG